MQSGLIEIIFLAMLAGFIALRLYHVLGRRTGHERPVGEPLGRTGPEVARPPMAPVEPEVRAPVVLPQGLEPGVREGLESVIAADRDFDPETFLEGARQAYAMTLDAFWESDEDTLETLAGDEVLVGFRAALGQRADAGQRVEARLVAVDDADIVAAGMNGMMAEIAVRFDGRVMMATYDADGNLVAGDPAQEAETHDIWTFSRHVMSGDPSWLLIGIDEAH